MENEQAEKVARMIDMLGLTRVNPKLERWIDTKNGAGKIFVYLNRPGKSSKDGYVFLQCNHMGIEGNYSLYDIPLIISKIQEAREWMNTSKESANNF